MRTEETMENPWLQFTKWPYEEAVYHFVVTASDGQYRAGQEFYAAAEDVAEFANKLKAFPRNRSDEAHLQVGQRDPGWAHWVSLRVYLYDAVGHSAIAVDLSNNADDPHRREARFTIRCEAASVNHLGEKVSVWLHGSEPHVRVELTPA